MLKNYTGAFEVKALTEDGEFEGYGSIFENEDSGGDKVMKGAFRNTLSAKPLHAIKMLFNHDSNIPIGAWEEMKEDDRGLFVKGRIIKEVAKGAEVLALMKAKVLDGLSIGYRTIKSEFDHDNMVRKLLELELWEVSVVTFPMNMGAKVDRVKNATPRDVEKALRDAGFAANYAKTVANHGAVKANELMGKKRDVSTQADSEFIRNLWSQ